MRRPKSIREIVEEYFNRKPIDMPLSEEAKRYIEQHLSQLIAALHTGRASPGAQHEAAGLIKVLTSRKRGHSSKPTSRVSLGSLITRRACTRLEATGAHTPRPWSTFEKPKKVKPPRPATRLFVSITERA
jgi:hypothetical protein